jgi:competence protein ComEC
MIMSGLIFAAIMLDRSPFSLRLVAFAALVVLCFDPSALFSASFQMSFAAVTGLIVFYDSIRERMAWWYRNAGWIRQSFMYLGGIAMTSVIASAATALFGLYHFQNFSGYGGLIANMAAIPLTGFIIMPAAALAMVLMPLGMGLEEWPLMIAGYGVQVMLDIAYYVSALEGAAIKIESFSFLAFILMASGLLLIALLKGPLKILAIIPALCGLFLAFENQVPDVLVSGTHKLVAVRDSEGVAWVNSVRSDKFSREVWERSWGMEANASQAFKNKDGACDDLGCRLDVSGHKIAYTMNILGQADDCAWADVMIAADPVEVKCAARVIDKFDTWRNGAHAVFLESDSITLKSVGEDRLARPWSMP